MDQVLRGEASEERVERRIARLAASQHGVFSRAQALASAATRGHMEWKVATASWEIVHRGVYRVAAVPRSWRQDLLAACLMAGDGAAASHRAAGALVHLPGIPEGTVEISAPKSRRVRRGGVVVHQVGALARVDVTSIDAVPSTTVTRTLIDIAAVLGEEPLGEAIDDALRRRLTTIPRLRRRLAELGSRGRAGAKKLQRVLDTRDGSPVSDSVLEARFLSLVRRARLPAPICQHPIRGFGRLVAVADFAWPEARLAVETEGYRWHSGRTRWSRDLARRNALTALGWRVLHVTWSDVHSAPDQLVETIAHVLGSVIRSGSAILPPSRRA
ncbi:MAG: DUF559 domain-containing protein [Actinomycetota bacterium]